MRYSVTQTRLNNHPIDGNAEFWVIWDNKYDEWTGLSYYTSEAAATEMCRRKNKW